MLTLILDNGSPFVIDISTYLNKLNINSECIFYDELKISELDKYDHVILSGRQKNNTNTNFTNFRVIDYCQCNNIPLLGICYGAEAINLFNGGTLIRMDNYVKDYLEIVISKSNKLLEKNAMFNVYESHKYAISRLPSSFESVAYSKFNKYEIIRHKSKNIYGVQFHPEKSGNMGFIIFSNFINK
ncbi:MAG: glutamine amidotransferase-related protein [Nitrososphaeraceae archaeon]